MPPRFYDLVDGDTGELVASDTMYRNRARSMVRLHPSLPKTSVSQDPAVEAC